MKETKALSRLFSSLQSKGNNFASFPQFVLSLAILPSAKWTFDQNFSFIISCQLSFYSQGHASFIGRHLFFMFPFWQKSKYEQEPSIHQQLSMFSVLVNVKMSPHWCQKTSNIFVIFLPCMICLVRWSSSIQKIEILNPTLIPVVNVR